MASIVIHVQEGNTLKLGTPLLRRISPCMQKLDGLEWVASFAVRCYGACLGFRVNRPNLIDVLIEALPPHTSSSRATQVDSLYSVIAGDSGGTGRLRRYNLLYCNALRLARTTEYQQLHKALAENTQMQVALHARRRLFVHAGVVSLEGHALVLPGRSQAGKTTLVRALLEAGATYYSDEYAVFDGQGRVHPYTKPLSLRTGPDGAVEEFRAEAFGAPSGDRVLPVSLIAVTEYVRGAHWRPRCTSPGNGVLLLMKNTVLARIRPAFALGTLRSVVTGARILKSKRGEAEDMAEALLTHLKKVPAFA